MQSRTARYAPWLIVFALMAAAAALHAHTAFAASPEQAIQTELEAQGQRYAGDCAATVPVRDTGKICSRLVEERDGRRAYLAGRTFSEFSRWVFVAQEAGHWRVVAEAPLQFDGPPEIPWP